MSTTKWYRKHHCQSTKHQVHLATLADTNRSFTAISSRTTFSLVTMAFSKSPTSAAPSLCRLLLTLPMSSRHLQWRRLEKMARLRRFVEAGKTALTKVTTRVRLCYCSFVRQNCWSARAATAAVSTFGRQVACLPR